MTTVSIKRNVEWIITIFEISTMFLLTLLSEYLPVESQQQKHWKKVCMLKVNNKDDVVLVSLLLTLNISQTFF